jgi:phosphoglycolate phosphatase-like HAD superfamily hydrolase
VLVADALTSATRRHGVEFPAGSVAVVGDTPHDVRAALAHGARAVGVATGAHPAEELLAAGAHAVLPDLADTERALAAILPAS